MAYKVISFMLILHLFWSLSPVNIIDCEKGQQILKMTQFFAHSLGRHEQIVAYSILIFVLSLFFV